MATFLSGLAAPSFGGLAGRTRACFEVAAGTRKDCCSIRLSSAAWLLRVFSCRKAAELSLWCDRLAGVPVPVVCAYLIFFPLFCGFWATETAGTAPSKIAMANQRMNGIRGLLWKLGCKSRSFGIMCRSTVELDAGTLLVRCVFDPRGMVRVSSLSSAL